jgi:predicted phosphate transport protein (TIGR00153 family)
MSMLTILKLFGRSPFTPLKTHMEKAAQCVHTLPTLFDALSKKDYGRMTQIAEQISEYEHQADLTKNDIRNHLPKTLFLPIDRGYLLEILTLQDSIADKAEDAAVITTLKDLEMLPAFREDFDLFLKKNIEAFDGALLIIKELHELLETSFGGVEAERVKSMVDSVAYKEHEADILQRKLLKALFQSEDKLSMSSFDLWQKIFEAIAAISNLSEKLAYRVRMTLELK